MDPGQKYYLGDDQGKVAGVCTDNRRNLKEQIELGHVYQLQP